MKYLMKYLHRFLVRDNMFGVLILCTFVKLKRNKFQMIRTSNIFITEIIFSENIHYKIDNRDHSLVNYVTKYI